MIGYGKWVSDTRQALNQFVTDTKDTDSSSKADWLSVVTAWLSRMGQSSAIAGAILTTTRVIAVALEGSSKTMSVAEMSDRENAALQVLSDQTANVGSDLAIYEVLRSQKASEPKTTSGGVGAGVLAARTEVKNQLNVALAGLPRPEAFRQHLSIAFVKRGVSSWDADNMQGSIAIFCDASLPGLQPPDMPDFHAEDDTLSVAVGDIKAGLATDVGSDNGAEGLGDEAGTLHALQRAYPGASLLDLPLNVSLNIRLAGTVTIVWARRGAQWAPEVEVGSRIQGFQNRDPFGSPLGAHVFRECLKASKQLGVADLRKFKDARAWW